MTKNETKPSIVIWGAGRLGTAMAQALSQQEYPTTLWSRRPPSMPSRGWEVSHGSLEKLASTSPPHSLWLITVNDDAIQEVSETLAKHTSSLPKVALHTSGRCPLHALDALHNKGVAVGVMHPLLPITERPHQALFAEGYVGIEGDTQARVFAQQITETLGGKTFSLQGIDRALYHAAAVVASNFLVTLAAQATHLLQAAGATENSLPLLLPLMQASLENLKHQGLPDALTGPYPRGDKETVQAHMEALRRLPPPTTQAPSLVALYTMLGQATIPIAYEQAVAHKKHPERVEALQALLDDPRLA